MIQKKKSFKILNHLTLQLLEKLNKELNVKEIIIKLFFILLSITGTGLVVKQLCTNMTYFFTIYLSTIWEYRFVILD